MRLLVTSDLHYNHRHSRPLADALIDQMNAAGGDVLLVVGDTATADGPALEQCLQRFRFAGPKLFVAGNHELWTNRSDSYAIYHHELPQRVRALGWHWLESEPFIADGLAILGSIGWYDYSFASTDLNVPRRFYENKISPGLASRSQQFASLAQGDDIPPDARAIHARWNDGRYVHLHRSDQAFLQELLDRLNQQLADIPHSHQLMAAVHHVPFAELLPITHQALFQFTRAFLGSERIGNLLVQRPSLRYVLCGHSHIPMEATIGQIQAINLGSGYRWKTFRTLEIGH